MSKIIAKKKYGQNFLDDEEILNKIEQLININKDESKVIEIGPGRGFLTEMLVKNSKKLIAYEIDEDLIDNLKNKYLKYPNFILHNTDFMTANIEDTNVKVVANIPYYITSPIIQKLLDNREKIDEIYLMVQKEVGIRLCTDKDISVFTHFVNFYCETEYLFTVKKEKFQPIPKVDSAFIKLKIRKDNKYEKLIDEKVYFNFVKLAFSNKRKTLYNNLKSIANREELAKYIDINKRAEELSIEEFIQLIKELNYGRI